MSQLERTKGPDKQDGYGLSINVGFFKRNDNRPAKAGVEFYAESIEDGKEVAIIETFKVTQAKSLRAKLGRIIKLAQGINRNGH